MVSHYTVSSLLHDILVFTLHASIVRLGCLMGQHVVYLYPRFSLPRRRWTDPSAHYVHFHSIQCESVSSRTQQNFRPQLHKLPEWAYSHCVDTTGHLSYLPNTPVHETGAQIVVQHDTPDLVLVATGSEVATCISAARLLEQDGVNARVVSMPCVETFLAQSKELRQSFIPLNTPRLTVEAATTMGWGRITCGNGESVGIDRFGASAPHKVLAEQFGFTADHIAARAKALLTDD